MSQGFRKICHKGLGEICQKDRVKIYYKGLEKKLKKRLEKSAKRDRKHMPKVFGNTLFDLKPAYCQDFGTF